jgi:hypothetical protein
MSLDYPSSAEISESTDDTPQSPKNPWADSEEKLHATLSRLPLAEQMAMLVGWLRDLSTRSIRDRQDAEKWHGEVMAALRSENDRRSEVEGDVRESLGHLAHALTTLATVTTETREMVTRIATQADADRAQADADKGLVLAELGTRAKADSLHDDRLEQVEKTGSVAVARVAATERTIIQVQRKLTLRSATTYAVSMGVMAGGYEAGKHLISLLLGH